MKIIVVGARGTIGSSISNHYDLKHDVITAGRSGCDLNVDISDVNSIKHFYKSLGSFDALIICAGEVCFMPFSEMKEEDFMKGIFSKLMGQINLVRLGQKHINKGGSFTLISGVLSEEPIIGSVSAATVNGAINSFVQSVSAEAWGEYRINAISPSIVEPSVDKHGDFFIGFNTVPIERVVNAYCRSVEGPISGRVLQVN